jgi:hypothetical protein
MYQIDLLNGTFANEVIMERAFTIMGDVIDSKKFEQRYLFEQLSNFLVECSSELAAEFIVPPKIHFGDEFQCVVYNLTAAIKTITFMDEKLLFNSKLFNFELHFVVAFGEIDIGLLNNAPSVMSGEVLWRARKLLGDKRSGIGISKKRGITPRQRDSYNFSLVNPKIEQILSDISYNLHWMRRHWKKEDLPLINAMLASNNDLCVANQFGLNRSSIYRRRISFRIPEYVRLKSALSSICDEFGHVFREKVDAIDAGIVAK